MPEPPHDHDDLMHSLRDVLARLDHSAWDDDAGEQLLAKLSTFVGVAPELVRLILDQDRKIAELEDRLRQGVGTVAEGPDPPAGEGLEPPAVI
jgi:hypothetical protein